MTTVYFATNREPNHPTHPTSFGNAFSEIGNLRFGSVSLNDEDLKFKQIDLYPDNPAQGSETVFRELQSSMRTDLIDVLIFVHGFNVSFEDAIKTAAQMQKKYSELSRRTYCPHIFVFSWASDASLLGYRNDRAVAEHSGYATARALLKVTDFLKNTSSNLACGQRVNLLAHSMGCYVLRYALQQAQKIDDGTRKIPRIFDEVILVAADEDSDAFEHDYKLKLLPNTAKRITVYFNQDDTALAISDRLKGNPDRLGHDGADKPNNLSSKVVLIEVTKDAVKGAIEHSYYLDNRVGADIVEVLRGENSEAIRGREYAQNKHKFRLLA